MSGTDPNNDAACFANSRGTRPARWASRDLVGKHVEDAVAAVLELEREPGEGAVFLLDDLATAAQELLNIALVSGLRRERHQQPLVHVAGARVGAHT